jgi:hypothetical protein
MKLRLAKNVVRLRLLRSEVSALQSGARLQELLCFGPEPSAHFCYTLQQGPDLNAPSVIYRNNELLVSIPPDQLRRWTTSDDVGIYAELECGTSQPISLLVEKDFACLDRSDAENADTYANPNMTC